MGNILKFPDKSTDLPHGTSYTIGRDNSIGVQSAACELSIFKHPDGFYAVQTQDMTISISRKSLAEFLHVASVLVDSEKRWMPDGDLVGLDYDD